MFVDIRILEYKMEPEDFRPWGDLVRSASGWERSDCWCDGHSSPSHYQDGTLYALLAAGALAFYVLYSAITMEAMAMEAGGGADQGANAFFRVKRNSASTFLTSELTSDSSLGDWMLRGRGSCLAITIVYN